MAASAVIFGALAFGTAFATDFGVSVGYNSALPPISIGGAPVVLGLDVGVPLVLGVGVRGDLDVGLGNFTARALATMTVLPGILVNAYIGAGLYLRSPLDFSKPVQTGPAGVIGVSVNLPILPTVFVEGTGEYDLMPAAAHAFGARAGLRFRF